MLSDGIRKRLGVHQDWIKDTADEDITGLTYFKKKRREFIKGRTSRDIKDYDCWRVWD